MSKKTLYWAIGIVVALIIVFSIWGMGNRNKSTQEPPSSELVTGIGQESTSHFEDSNRHTNHNQTSASDNDSEDPALTAYLNEQNSIMNRMVEDMENVEQSGNAAIDFLTGMIPHHEAAVEMAESYLKHGGSDDELTQMANNVIDTQKKEITQMEEMYETIKASGKQNQDQADAYWQEYEEMLSGHHMGHSTGDVSESSIDAAFAEGMLMHHQMAVDMAVAILDQTDEESVKTLAQEIIDAQEEEIKLMQDYLDHLSNEHESMGH